METYDVIVIGGGTAGLAAYRKATSLGKKALIVESFDFVTTCANVGCMPSKLLIAAAENMHEIHKSEQFGIHVKQIEVNAQEIFQRVRSERDRFVGFVRKGAQNISNKVMGTAQFIDSHTIRVNDILYKATSFVLATGSSTFIPAIFNDLKKEILTNDNVFDLQDIPSKIAVFGSGVIGLELGFAFQHLGSQVSLFYRGNKILKLHDNLHSYTLEHMKNTFTNVVSEEVQKIEKINNKYCIYYNDTFIEVDKILVATGRKPNIEQLDFEKTGISFDLSQYNRETTQLGNSHIFLAGDINNDSPLLHEAAKEGEFSGENAAHFPYVKKFKRHVPLNIIFSSPQIIQVGQTHNLPEDIIQGVVSFEDQGRSRVMLKNKGLLHLYFSCDNHKLLGAEMIGPDAEHVAHLLAWIIEKNTNLEDMLNFPYYHPVIEEGIRTAVRHAKSQLK